MGDANKSWSDPQSAVQRMKYVFDGTTMSWPLCKDKIKDYCTKNINVANLVDKVPNDVAGFSRAQATANSQFYGCIKAFLGLQGKDIASGVMYKDGVALWAAAKMNYESQVSPAIDKTQALFAQLKQAKSENYMAYFTRGKALHTQLSTLIDLFNTQNPQKVRHAPPEFEMVKKA